MAYLYSGMPDVSSDNEGAKKVILVAIILPVIVSFVLPYTVDFLLYRRRKQKKRIHMNRRRIGMLSVRHLMMAALAEHHSSRFIQRLHRLTHAAESIAAYPTARIRSAVRQVIDSSEMRSQRSESFSVFHKPRIQPIDIDVYVEDPIESAQPVKKVSLQEPDKGFANKRWLQHNPVLSASQLTQKIYSYDGELN